MVVSLLTYFGLFSVVVFVCFFFVCFIRIGLKQHLNLQIVFNEAWVDPHSLLKSLDIFMYYPPPKSSSN